MLEHRQAVALGVSEALASPVQAQEPVRRCTSRWRAIGDLLE
jgi:predicted secreted protein